MSSLGAPRVCTHRLGARVVELVRANVERLALDLVGPPAVVPDAPGDGADVPPRHADGLSVVERLNGGELLRVGLDEVGELQEQAAALAGGGGPPGALEGLAGGGDGGIDILLGGLADGADDLLGGGVDDLELLLVGALDELVVDEAGGVLARDLQARQGRGERNSQADGLLVGARDGGGEFSVERHYDGIYTTVTAKGGYYSSVVVVCRE